MTDDKLSRFKFFMPGARVLTPEEISKLPDEKIALAESDGDDGLWLEIECANKTCLDEDGNIHIPARGMEKSGRRGLFLRIFCPEGSCRIVESTDVP